MIGLVYWIIGDMLPFVRPSPLITTELGPLFSDGWLIWHLVEMK